MPRREPESFIQGRTVRTEEVKKQISEKLRGRPKSDAHKAAISAGRKKAEPKIAETRAKKRSAAAQTRYEEAQRAKKENGGAYKPGSVTEAPTTPENRVRKNMPICGAKRTGKSFMGEGICCMPAGWGTDHVGTGACRYHAGTMPTHMMKAVREESVMKAIQYGAPVDIDPDTAVLQELCRTQGHVDWLREQVNNIQDGMLFAETPFGLKPSVILQQYQEERRHLLKVAEVAKRMGIAERQIRLAEEQGRLIAMILKNFMQDPDLALTPQQKIVGRDLMRRHILAIDAVATELILTDAAK